MFDYSISQNNTFLSLYVLLLFFLIVFSHRRKVMHYVGPITDKYNIILLFLGILLYCLTDFNDGDFYHYMEEVHTFNPTSLYQLLEEVYTPVIMFVDRNYFLFRFVVWGSALALVTATFSRLKVQRTYLLLYVFAVMFMYKFGYARASLAFAIYFWGLSFIIKPYKNRFVSWCFAIALIFVASFFHRSALLLVVMTFLIFAPFNKYTVTAIIIAIPFILQFMSSAFEQILLMGAISDDVGFNNRLQSYSEDQKSSLSPSAMLLSTLENLSFYIPFLVLTYQFFYSKFSKLIDRESIRLYKLTFGVMLVVTFFFFVDFGSRALFYRVMYMTSIPLAILLCRIYEQGFLRKKLFWRLVLLGGFSQCLTFIYGLYCTFFDV